MNKTWLFYEKARWIMEVLSERCCLSGFRV